ncbi:hypothetical protein UA08_03717 [Talaromyces atroroseus]|uniref:RTA1 domain protein n=1 Tax=Talaromyces atroroseus TaxID=1441469 RepID=A0A225AHM3_TALAT|nr:hypothetical protein UA08_03717 [Talaromyces atroroseus]OKL60942.1 hypothetical protein UA08_03717 [Talaromyces atroroseus]
MSSTSASDGLYPYHPSHVLPAVFSALIGISFLWHIYQNFRYKFWSVTFWMSWGGAVFTIGWITRCISSYNTSNVDLYIVQTVFIYAGPPIYSASAYNILGRLLYYLPMHAPLHPGRVTIAFVYMGAAVEALTAAGASTMASNTTDLAAYQNGGTLISAALVLQAVVEGLVVSVICMVHFRTKRVAHSTPPNVQRLCITLYGTSFLVILRCICRAVESFTIYSSILSCAEGNCSPILTHEWYLYSFEAAPMVLFTYWLNIMHPGICLPRQNKRYLDLDCKTERLGPGWVDRRSKWQTFVDPFDLSGMLSGQPNHESFWLLPEKWPVADGSFAQGTASNVSGLTNKSVNNGQTMPSSELV